MLTTNQSISVATADDGNDQTPHELGAQMLHRLRRRHNLAERAASTSTLSCSSQTTSRDESENDWQTDDEDCSHVSSSFAQSLKRSTRARRRSSTQQAESPFSPSIKRVSRAQTNVNRRSVGKGDQRWISLLERNNEELLSQIETLTSDADSTEKSLKHQLQAIRHEVSCLKDQLHEKEKFCKTMTEQYESKFRFLRTLHTEQSNTQHSRPSAQRFRTRNLSMNDHDVRKLIQERDSLRIKAKGSELELLKYKRRNAALAEQILHKGSLEMTVEGQNRYLLELSAALEESRRGSISEPSYSPISPLMGSFPDTPLFSPLLAENQYVSKRPVSFDGTQWAPLAQARRQFSIASMETLARPHTASPRQPITPPVTEPDMFSPLKQEMCTIDDHDSETSSTQSTLEKDPEHSIPVPYGRNGGRPLRPTLRRNESSLWAELWENTVDSNIATSVSCDDSSAVDVETMDDTVDEICSNASNTTTYLWHTGHIPYLIQIRGRALAESLRILLCGWAWLCFLALLFVAVGKIVLDGPEYMNVVTRPRRSRSNNIIEAAMMLAA